MASVNDWAAKAAEYIAAEFVVTGSRKRSAARIAAIIATFAEPLVELLRESKREHDTEQNYCCDAISMLFKNAPCTCGADEWNERVNEVLNGVER